MLAAKENKFIKKIFIIVLIFTFSISLRLWNLNKMGRTWDEGAYVEYGYKFLQLVKKGDFTNAYWYKTSDEPPLVRYIYAIPSYFDVSQFSPNGDAKFKYDYTYSRIVSAIASSVSVIFVILVGWELLSPLIGVIAGVIFSMLPFYLGLSQLATLESFIMLFFTSSIYFFLKFLKRFSLKFLILSGVSIGLALQTKYTNILLIPLIICIYYIWYFNIGKKKGNIFEIKIVYIFLISLFVFFILWPIPWFHLKEIIEVNYKWRILGSKYSVPEVFFGRLMLTPVVYYVIYFLITTPFLILTLFLVGIKKIDKSKNWIFYVILAWFILPFIQSFYNFRQHGVRYIIEIYAPLSLLAAMGFDFIVGKLTKKILLKFVYFVPIIIYMGVIIFRITPYYLDYFNILVGGTGTVYEKKLFQLGWWGQGIREAGLYLEKTASKGSRVGLAVDPKESMPRSNRLILLNYSDSISYDYVMVGYYRITRLGFDDSKIKKNYNLIYTVKADGAVLVWVYKKK